MSQTYYANLANDRLIVIEQYANALQKLVEQAKYAQWLMEEDYQPNIIPGLNEAIINAEKLLKGDE